MKSNLILTICAASAALILFALLLPATAQAPL
jgi:hypothetical protein